MNEKLFTAEDMERAWIEGEKIGWENANSIPERQKTFEQSETKRQIVMSEKIDISTGRMQKLTDMGEKMAAAETARLMSDLGLFREYEREAIQRTMAIMYHQGAIDASKEAMGMLRDSHQWDHQRRADAVKGAHP